MILMQMSGDEVKVSLYFHVPFCTHKCAYCHFYVIPDKDPFKAQWLEGVRCEWQRWRHQLADKRVVSVYFGGGTPSLIGPGAISEIMSWIRPILCEGAEVTLEANPENISQELMSAYAAAGVNRVSIGIQTLDSALLKRLERLHSPHKALEAVHATSLAGIENISVDLMYDLPGQTLKGWEETLEQVRRLPITHLSLYNLTIEPHTVFFKYRKSLYKELPDPETSLAMYLKAIAMLEEVGLMQYEISAFAKGEHASRHNSGYWTGRPFLGIGPSAFSFWEGKRFRNVAHLGRYCKALAAGESPVDFEEELSAEAGRCERLAIHLRLLAGVDLRAFESECEALSKETMEALLRLEEQGMVMRKNKLIALTSKGILFYDTVATELVTE